MATFPRLLARLLTGLLCVVLLVAVSVPSARAQASDPVAFAIAEAEQAAGVAGGFVVATSSRFPDALTSSQLNAAVTGPVHLLLTGPGTLDPRVDAHIQRHTVAGRTVPVWVMGGADALSADVEAQLAEIAGIHVTRLAGVDRVGTALAAADTVVAGARSATVDVFVARSHGQAGDPDGTAAWVDSLAAGPLIAAREPADPAVLLLTGSAQLDRRVARWLGTNPVGSVVALGGPTALSEQVVDELEASARQVTRVAGSDRYATASALVMRTLGWNANVHVAGHFTEYVALHDSDDRDGWASALARSNTRTPVLWARGVAAGAYEGLVRGCGTRPLRDIDVAALDGPLAGHVDGAVRKAAAGCASLWQATTADRWDACTPVRVRVNYTNAPADADRQLRAALSQVGQHSGLRFHLETTADSPPSGNPTDWARQLKDRYGRDQRGHPVGPIGVAWPSPWRSSPEYAGIAVALPTGRGLLDGGAVLIRDDQDGGEYLQELLLHEIGHTLGIGHVDGLSVMSGHATGEPVLHPGDRDALRWAGGNRQSC